MATIQLPTAKAATLDVGGMSPQTKIELAIRRSLPMLPAEARQQVMQMLTPTSLAIMGGTLVAWAGSHLFGIGEIVDVILLVTGFALVGLSAVTGAQELYAFATGAIRARSDADLDRAAKHFASAVTILGIATISALLLRSSGKAVRGRAVPRGARPMPNVGAPPAAGIRPKITRPFRLPGGALGETDWWGNIAVTRNQTLNQQKLTLYHEWVHRVLSPRVAPLRQIRAQLRASGYMRSALLRYIEEALAESYAQLRVNGLSSLLVGMRFPLAGGYVTVSQLATEGVAIGNIMLGGMLFTVRVVQGHWAEPAK
jgi:hypothetical protein